MTAQEAAKKQTRFYRWLAAIFAAGGLTALGGLFFDDLKVAATSAGGGGMVLSALGFAVDWLGKKLQGGVADKVSGNIKSDIEDLKTAVIQGNNAISQLSLGLSRSEAKQDKRHAENHRQISEIIEIQHEHGEALEKTMDAVATLKEGWQKPQLKKPKG